MSGGVAGRFNIREVAIKRRWYSGCVMGKLHEVKVKPDLMEMAFSK